LVLVLPLAGCDLIGDTILNLLGVDTRDEEERAEDEARERNQAARDRVWDGNARVSTDSYVRQDERPAQGFLFID
jgi:hypothetical protein